MHADEAVHAIKFGALLEHNDYQYDPYEYHGPTLNYFTLLPARISGAGRLVEMNEIHLRIVPVFFGLLLLAGFPLIKKEIGAPAALGGAFLTAISPAFVFYSRYYIQEMLFTAFSFFLIIFVYKYMQRPRAHWAVLTGIVLALLHSTKETCILAFAVLLFAGWAIVLFYKIKPVAPLATIIRHVLFGCLAAVVVSATLFSSFFTHPQGIVDSILTFKTYLNRGIGEHQAHLYPWYYYFKWLLFNKMPGRPLWTEAFIVLLAICGAYFVLRSPQRTVAKPLLTLFLLYSLILAIVYSSIPYKTPWSMLSWYHVFIILAGNGAYGLICGVGSRIKKTVIIILFSLGSLYLLFQSILQLGRYSADVSNPYVYAHTSTDIYHIKDMVDKVSRAHTHGHNMYIEVICPGHDYWPLPWYFRNYPHVAYRDRVDFDAPSAQIIIAKPEVEKDLIAKLYEMPPPGKRDMYLPLFDENTQLRPFVEIRGYIRKDLFDLFYYHHP